MNDHPVLIPTPEGAVGGIVSEPPGEARAKLVLLPGYGRPARSGTNAFWARTARALAQLGIVVLRVDYSREGETLPVGEGGSGLAWKSDLDLRLVRESVRWFSARAGNRPLFLAGACAGTRLSISLAAEDPAAFAGVFHVVLDLRAMVDEGSGLSGPDVIDPLVVEDLQAVLAQVPSWVVTGERDRPDIPRLKRLLGPTEHELELEVVHGAALHFLDRPDIQAQAGSRLLARVARALGECGQADRPPALSGSRPPAGATS